MSKPLGRPTVITPEIITKLEEAFSVGASDKEAIFYANIGSSTFYEYCSNNPDFAERKEQLKDMPKYQARKNISKALNDGDKDISKWYAERKIKGEFSPRQELTGEDGGPVKVESNVITFKKYGEGTTGS